MSNKQIQSIIKQNKNFLSFDKKALQKKNKDRAAKSLVSSLNSNFSNKQWKNGSLIKYCILKIKEERPKAIEIY